MSRWFKRALDMLIDGCQSAERPHFIISFPVWIYAFVLINLVDPLCLCTAYATLADSLRAAQVSNGPSLHEPGGFIPNQALRSKSAGLCSDCVEEEEEGLT